MYQDKFGETDKSRSVYLVEMLKNGWRIDFAGEKSYAESKEESEADILCRYWKMNCFGWRSTRLERN